MIGSASQCPGTALSSAWGGRRLMVAPWIQLLPLGLGSPASGERGMRRMRPVRRAFSTRNWARALPAPWTYRAWWICS